MAAKQTINNRPNCGESRPDSRFPLILNGTLYPDGVTEKAAIRDSASAASTTFDFIYIYTCDQ